MQLLSEATMAQTTAIVLIMFVASFVRSAFGFGEALIAVPLLALFIPIDVAAPVTVLVSIVIALMVILQDWGQMHIQSAVRLFLSTLFGIPLGLLLLISVPELLVRVLLAVAIVGFSAYSLFGRRRLALTDDRLAPAFGFVAGILGGAYAMNGPPLVMYGAMRQWSPQHFRATLQGYFLPAGIVGMIGYRMTGLWTPLVTRYFLLTLPVVLGAVFLGRWLNRRMEGPMFLRYIHIGLIVVGLLLLFT